MSLKKLPPQCIAPLRLKEITLHGIGSYYDPARLEIKPLTVLCGTNGSGKSTWIKVLSVLQKAAEPSQNPEGASASFHERLLNLAVRYHLLSTNIGDIGLHEKGWNTYCGPKGSLSLTLTSTRNICLPKIEGLGQDIQSELERHPVLFSTLLRGDTVRVRFSFGCFNETWWHAIRFCVNTSYIEWRYSLCSPNNAILLTIHEGTESNESQGCVDTQSHEICRSIRPAGGSYFEANSHSEDLCQHFISAIDSRTSFMLDHFWNSFFRIDAIRHAVDTAIDQNATNGSQNRPRFVGEHGQFAHEVRALFATVPILDPTFGRPYGINTRISGELRLFDFGRQTRTSIPHRPKYLNNPIAWSFIQAHHPDLLEQFSNGLYALPSDVRCREQVASFIVEFDAAMTSGVFSRFHLPMEHEPGRIDSVTSEIEDLFNIYYPAFDDLSNRPDHVQLLLECIRRTIQRGNSPFQGQAYNTFGWAAFLASLPDSERTPIDSQLLEDWFSNTVCDQSPDLLTAQSLFEKWADKLISGWIVDGGENRLTKVPLTGYVTTLDPIPIKENYTDQYPYSNHMLDSTRAGSVNVDLSTRFNSGMFSAGFHQLVPIIVQGIVMRMNEVLAVENPEVHLHPGLQLKFMEFFIENALIGKYAIIETHSDLMIRRILRAITEEKIRQSWVNIAFVDTAIAQSFEDDFLDRKKEIWTSRIATLRMDDRGVISNWPEGFLDDDEKETKSLMRALYGDRLFAEDPPNDSSDDKPLGEDAYE